MMNWKNFFTLGLLLLLSGTYLLAQSRLDSDFAADELIISFREEIPVSQIQAFLAKYRFHIFHSYRLLPNTFCVRRVERGLRKVASGRERKGIEELVSELTRQPGVLYAEPNYVVHASEIIPNDPFFSQLWGLHNTGQTGGANDADIDAPEAWGYGPAVEVLVGVIDSGVDWTHEDLANNIWHNPDEIPGNGVDDDHNGYIDDIRGWDFVNDDNNPYDDEGHGTHVSGTIAAIGNNGIGVAGINWKAKIVALKFLDNTGSGFTSEAILALDYAVDLGVKLSNNSWGGGSYSQAMYNAIQNAGRQGHLFIAAAGNGGDDGIGDDTDRSPHYPSSYGLGNIIAVAATDDRDRRAGFSNYGAASVDLGAPGVDILSTIPNNDYAFASGTSMATPHVTGVASLIWSLAPDLSASKVKDILLRSVDPIPDLGSHTVSGGRLNAYRAVTLVEQDSIPPDPVTDLSVEQTASNWVVLTWTATGDDSNSGTALAYDIRYALHPIDSANFQLATAVANPPVPKPSGQAEHFQVTGLQFNTSYYFALRVSDEHNNASAISNSVQATTLGIPVVGYSPGSMKARLLTGQTETRYLTITNQGEGILDFVIPDLIASSRLHRLGLAEAVSTAGIHLELTKDQQDPRRGAPVVLGVGGPDQFGYTWIDSDENGAPAFDWVDISRIGTSISLGDDDYLEVMLPFPFSFYGREKTRVKISSNGYLTFGTNAKAYTNDPIPNTIEPNDLIAPFWDDLNPSLSGKVYYHFDSSRNRFIVQYDHLYKYSIGGPYTFEILLYEDGRIVFQYLDMNEPLYAATVGIENSDGSDGLQIVFNSNYLHDNLAIHIAVSPRWFNVNPVSGSIPADSSAVLEVLFDARKLSGAEYQDQLAISTNDPQTPTVTIPLVLNVESAANIVLSKDSLRFQDVFVGTTAVDSFSVWNDGWEFLTVHQIGHQEQIFRVEPENFVLDPGEKRFLRVRFSPEKPAVVLDTLKIFSDDPDRPVVQVPLVGEGVLPPAMRYSPDSLAQELYSGYSRDAVMTFTNTGGTDLNVELKVAYQDTATVTIELPPPKTLAKDTEYRQPVEERRSFRKFQVPLGLQSQIGEVDVLLLSPDDDITDLRAALNPFQDLRVTIFPRINLINLSVDDLHPYDVVLLTNNTKWAENGGVDPAKVGDVLADYIDAGGRVIVNNFAYDWAGWELAGRFATEKYGPFTMATSDFSGVATLGTIYRPDHPILAGVSSLRTDFLRQNQGLSTSAVRLADWNDGNVLLAVKGKVVGVNILPSDGSGGATYEGDLPTLYHNAVIWLTGGKYSWLSLEPASAVLPPGTSRDIQVRFNGRGLKGGDYHAHIAVSSNDPVKLDSTRIPVHLHLVDGAKIEVSTDSIDFGRLYLGSEKQDSLFITNAGSDTLNITRIAVSDSQFTLLDSTAKIPPGRDKLLELRFRPSHAGVSTAHVIFQSNDPITGEMSVILTGTGILPPVIVVSADTVKATLVENDSTKKSLWIQNSGQSDLLWDIVPDSVGMSRWITVTPDSGTIPPGQVQRIQMDWNSSRLSLGLYSGRFLLFSNDPVRPVDTVAVLLSVVKEKKVQIALTSGWNLISWNVDSENDSIRVLLQQILPNLRFVLGYDSVAYSFYPDLSDVINTLKILDPTHGYWMNMNAADTLELLGKPVDGRTPLRLRKGWNLIGYLPADADSIRHALKGIMDHVEVVLSFYQAGLTFKPELPDFLNTLTVMQPTRGYWLKMLEPDTLVFPEVQIARLPFSLAKAESDGPLFQFVHPSSRWISLYGEGLSWHGTWLPAGTMVKAMDSRGVVCGLGMVRTPGRLGLMPIYRDDPSTESVDEGADPGEAITIYFDDTLVPIPVSWTAFGDVLNLGELITRIGVQGESPPKSYALLPNYPNPFNPSTELRYQIPENIHVEIKLFDILGREVITLVDQFHQPGYYHIQWNGRDRFGSRVATGIYLIRMKAGEFFQTRKLFLLR